MFGRKKVWTLKREAISKDTYAFVQIASDHRFLKNQPISADFQRRVLHTFLLLVCHFVQLHPKLVPSHDSVGALRLLARFSRAK